MLKKWQFLIEKILTFLFGSKQRRISIHVRDKQELEEEVESNLSNNSVNIFSQYFSLEEVTKSEIAVRKGIDNIPSKDQIFQIQQLCSVILDRIRSHYNKPIRITSGYRDPKLNKAIGGSSKSQHCAQNKDAAIDFEFFDTSVNLEAVFHWITQLSNLPFDQCIAEFLPEGWIHISYKSNGIKNRNKITRAIKVNGKTQYKQLGYAKWGKE